MQGSSAARVISSRLTPVYKFILPALGICGFGLVALFMPSFHGPDGSPPPPALSLAILAVWAGATWMWCRSCIPLKKVSIDGSDLIISNYAREVRWNLRRTCRISERRWHSPRLVTIAFDEDVGFGRVISFMPNDLFLWPWQEHPVVKELRDLSVAQCRSG